MFEMPLLYFSEDDAEFVGHVTVRKDGNKLVATKIMLLPDNPKAHAPVDATELLLTHDEVYRDEIPYYLDNGDFTVISENLVEMKFVVGVYAGGSQTTTFYRATYDSPSEGGDFDVEVCLVAHSKKDLEQRAYIQVAESFLPDRINSAIEDGMGEAILCDQEEGQDDY